MFTCSIENSRGNAIKLTQNESDYQVLKIEGLNPPKAQINRSKVAGLDGSRFNSSTLEERNIVITLRINGDVESNRNNLYNFAITKEICIFYYKNGLKDVHIEGYVETVEVDPFTNSEIMQISIVCPDPYFKDAQLIVDDISKILNNFEFPFAINVDEPIPFAEIEIERVTDVFNNSDSEIGIIIEVVFLGTVNTLRIINVDNGDTFTVNHQFITGDILTINTNKGSKSVDLNRNGIHSNMFSKVVKGSTFFNLQSGDNYFSYLADGGSSDDKVSIVYKHYTVYRGV
ncbi:phage distal tail protein [Priestia megaterium]|uniref:phage distal tail protein n=1 Tax=Priestia megaterium TaxID=1404 RepID=UPI002E1F1B9E|nr:phage tail family protein [Priestia megaterium]